MIWDVDQFLVLPNIETMNWKPQPHTEFRSLIAHEKELARVNAKYQRRLQAHRDYEVRRALRDRRKPLGTES